MAAFLPLASDRHPPADPKSLKAIVDRRLDALLPPTRPHDELGQALRYSLLAPGKRIRPILTVLASFELGAPDLRALDAGCALEMVHAASLILDDLPAMDDAATRRGQPSTHVRFGEDVAMLAAITLLSLAYGTVGAMSHVPAEIRCGLVGVLARAVGPDGLAGGQYADLRPNGLDGLDGAAETNRRKTAALFTAAAEIACLLQGAAAARAAQLQRSVSELGQAYQILDDLIDRDGVDGAGRPEDAAKATILSLIGVDGARLRLRHHVHTALTGLRPAGPLAGYVTSLFERGLAEWEPA